MSTTILDEPVAAPATPDDQGSLAARIEELARLRFSIVLTAKWESSECEDLLYRKELRGDLHQLNALYFEKIDEIAMAFGVQAAIDAKERVEREVNIPQGAKVGALRVNELDDEENCGFHI